MNTAISSPCCLFFLGGGGVVPTSLITFIKMIPTLLVFHYFLNFLHPVVLCAIVLPQGQEKMSYFIYNQACTRKGDTINDMDIVR